MMIYLWNIIYEILYMMYYIWYTLYDILYMTYDIFIWHMIYMIYYIWYIIYDILYMLKSIWYIIYCIWYLIYYIFYYIYHGSLKETQISWFKRWNLVRVCDLPWDSCGPKKNPAEGHFKDLCTALDAGHWCELNNGLLGDFVHFVFEFQFQ